MSTEATQNDTFRDPPTRTHRGLILINTGTGKGKTTAAIGLMIRAWGQGQRPCMIQFIKSRNDHLGELRAARALGLEWHQLGDGFTWRSHDLDETAAKNLAGWKLAQEKIASGMYDMIVLDEFTYLLKYGWLDVREVITWLGEHKPGSLHLVITGRDAPPALVQYADLVTDMTKVKHHHDAGVRAQPGIEF